MHVEEAKDHDRTENRCHDCDEVCVEGVVCNESDGGGEQADDGEQSWTFHPAGNLGMSEELIGHDDQGWEEKEAETCYLSSGAEDQDERHEADAPEAVVRWCFE